MNETTLFVGRLTVIDFSYLHDRRGLLGESWIVDVELTGNLDDEGVIFDFGDAKKKIKQILDASIDHTLVVPMASPQLAAEDGGYAFTYGESAKRLRVLAPASSFFCADVASVTKGSLKPILEQLILDGMPKNVSAVRLELKTEQINTPFYHYSHGLKKHDGNCQRIAHGHRSKLDIFVDEVLTPEHIAYYADVFTDSYVITKEDIDRETDSHFFVSYTASQGQFSLEIPKENCVIIENETTVEQIAHFIADDLAKKQPQKRIRVRAYEGVEKGAIAERV